MTDTEPRRFRKTVAIKATDEEERTATGAALVPNEVDRQRDFLRPDGIQAMFNPDPDDGVMHYKFADDDAELVRNEIIDEPETIGGREYDPGSWIIKRKYHDDDLWQLVKDGVLNAFSIGGDVSKEVEYDLEELPEDVTFPAEVKEGPATEIVNGATDEISDVDIPAVPNADFAAVKALDKNLVEEASGEDEFVELMEPRGHSEEDARRLWAHLQKSTHEMKNDSDDPDAASLDDVDDATLGKRLKEFLFGTSDASDGESADIELADSSPTEAEKALTILKEGRTLSQANRETLMAAHDAIEAALASDMDFETNRFTDSENTDFDIAQYGDSDEKLAKLTEEQGRLVTTAIQRFVDAQGDATFGEFCDWLWQTDALDDDTAFAADEAAWSYREWTREQRETAAISEDFVPYVMAESDTDTEITMTDDTKTDDNPPAWAKTLTENVEQIEKRVSEMEEDGDAEKSLEDAPAWAQTLAEKVDGLDERVDKVSKATADTQQVGGTEKTGGEDDDLSKTEKQKRELFGLSGGD